MSDLPKPYEHLDLPDRGVLVTRVTSWEQGTTTIVTPKAPNGKVIDVVRVHVPLEDKPHVPPYWDITATSLHQALLGLLPEAVKNNRWLRIQKFGVAPAARFTISLLPLDYKQGPIYGLETQ